MCDPLTIMMIASSAMQAKQSMDQAKRMEQNAARQAKAQYEASDRQLKAEYAEANRKIAEEQEDNLGINNPDREKDIIDAEYWSEEKDK